jgi:tetratricopeptide (TPR) repeat protein
MQRGDLQDALEAYAKYVLLVRDTQNGVARNLFMAWAADAHLRAGKVDDAAMIADRALQIAEFAKAPHYRALARRVQAQVLAARGEADDAAKALDDAVLSFEQTGSRLELGRALYHRARLRFSRGDRHDARVDAARARELFAETGAAPDRARAEVLLAS